MRKKNLLLSLLSIIPLAGIIFIVGCSKEGPMGPAGKDGAQTCGECHNPNVVEMAATQFELSKHSWGEAAFEEAGNTTCGPCHESEAFKYVCENNTPSTFTLNTTTNKYVNDYTVAANAAYGEITCSTCHSSLHSTYGIADFSPLTTTAPVAMSMWAGAKTINLTADGGISNLCVKCHQPRPFAASAADGNVLDYVGLATNPTDTFYSPTLATASLKIKPGYRTHTHYGTAGAIYAGMGGVEFPGTLAYTNSGHTTLASCQDCHMADMTGAAGGHSFVAKGNFNGCNVSGCHTNVSSTSTTFWVDPRAEIKGLLNELASKLVINGIEIMNRNPDSETNLWVSNTTNKYDGYLNIYDPINNPDGITNNPAGTFQNPSPSSSWTAEQKAINLALPKIYLLKAHMGGIINFQMCLRDYSLGIHNYAYTKALLTNTIAKL